MGKTKWYLRRHCEPNLRAKRRGGVAILLALALVPSLGIVAVPMAGTVEANTQATGVWVDDNYTLGSCGGHMWGYDAFDNIQDGIDNVADDGTVHVAAGTYNETVEVNKELTLQGEGKDVVTVTAADSDDYVFEVTAHNVTISGFNITGAQKCGVYLDKRRHCEILHNIITANGDDGIYIDKSSDNTISGNGITANGGYGIYINKSSDNTISGNEITANGDDGICLHKGSDNTISGNGITANGGYGIYIDKDSGNTISDNEITANDGGINLDSSNNNDISKNDILNNSAPDSGIHLNSDSQGNAIHLNNIVGNSPYGVHNEAAEMVDAENNWWGDASGPEDTSSAIDCKPPSEGGWNCDVCDENPDGTGDKVSDNVNYCPWLLEQYAPTKSTGTATGTGSASFSPDTGALEGLTAVDEGDLPEEGKPGLEFLHGFFSFNIVGLTPGQMVVVTITLPEDVPEGTEYWKYHEPEGWVDVTSLLGDDDGDNVLTLAVTDGGLGDDDGECNGIIVDQGGPGFYIHVGGEAYPVNKVLILMPWIALGIAVIAGVAVVLRRCRV